MYIDIDAISTVNAQIHNKITLQKQKYYLFKLYTYCTVYVKCVKKKHSLTYDILCLVKNIYVWFSILMLNCYADAYCSGF